MQNLLKSIFIPLYSMAIFIITGYSVSQLIQHGFSLVWLGVLLTTIPVLSLIFRAMVLKNISRTSPRLMWMVYLAVTGCAVVFILDDSTDIRPLLLAITATITLVLYSFWFSSFNREPSSEIVVGRKLPSFSVQDVKGKNINSEALLSGPTLLVFYRGNWCPFCMAQVKEIAAQYHRLTTMGVRVVFVSPQPIKEQIKISERFDAGVSFVRDVKNNAAKKLNIVNHYGLPAGMQAMGFDTDTPLPTVILTDHNGLVVYKNETDNYRVRPEPESFIAIAKTHLTTPKAA